MTTTHPLSGTTVHVTHGTRYYGAFEDAEITPIPHGFQVKGGRSMIAASADEIHASEAEARAHARSLRRPRQTRTVILDRGGWANVPGLNRMMGQ